MVEDRSRDKKDTVDSFSDMFSAFGEAMSELFDDPELKRNARQFADGAISSAKTFARRFGDEDVRARFRNLGKAAEEFGKSVADEFRDDPRE